MTTLSSLFVPTTYGTLTGVVATETGLDSTGAATFNNSDAAAEYKAFMNYIVPLAKAGKGSLGDDNWANSEFNQFLKNESHWYSGDFRIPFTSVIFSKWIAYIGGAGALWFLLR